MELVANLQALQEAEELRQRRDSERDKLSKNQLARARRKLGRLYQKALGGQTPGDAASAHSPAASQLTGSHAGCDAPGVAERVLYPAVDVAQASEYTEVSVTALPVPAPADGLQSVTMVAASCSTEDHTAQGGAASLIIDGVATSSHIVPAHGVPAPLAPGRLSRVPVTAPAGRGRQLDMSAMLHMLHVHMASPGAPDAMAPHTASGCAPGRPAPLLQQETPEPAPAPSQAHQFTDASAEPDEKASAHPASTSAARKQAVPQPQSPNNQAKRKKPQHPAVYGNYHGYYGYRHAGVDAFDDDPRLAVLQTSWFAGRHMLDVGCNEGLVTLAVAMRFGCASATGVDIDRALIGKANRNLKALRSSVAKQLQAGRPQPRLASHTAKSAPTQATSAPRGARADATDPGPSAQVPASALAAFFLTGGQAAQTVVADGKNGAEALQGTSTGQPDVRATDTVGPAEPPAAGERQMDHVDGSSAGVQVAATAALGPGQTPRASTSRAAPSRTVPSKPLAANRAGEGAGMGSDAALPSGGAAKAPAPLQPHGLHTWPALRIAAKALSNAAFYHQDWANEDQPRAQGGPRTGGGAAGAGPATSAASAGGPHSPGGPGDLGTTSQPAGDTPSQGPDHTQPAEGESPGAGPAQGHSQVHAQRQGPQQQQQSTAGVRLRKRYGAIMCLSVTKWVHLNWGDAGLRRLFAKFASCLETGGYLVLEPQPWRSYKAAVGKVAPGLGVSDLSSLQLRPEHFVDLLTQEHGFVLLADLNETSSAIGFDRPMYVFQKTHGRPGKPRFAAAPGAGQVTPGGSAAASGSVAPGGKRDRGAAGSTGSARKRQRSGGSSGMTRSHRRQPKAEDLLKPLCEKAEDETVEAGMGE